MGEAKRRRGAAEVETPAEPSIEIAGSMEEVLAGLNPTEAGYEMPDPPTPEEVVADENAIRGITAFYVVIREDGRAVAISDCNANLVLQRGATLDDIWAACSEVGKDVMVTQTVNTMMMTMMQTGAQVAEQQRVQSLVHKLNERGIRAQPGAGPGGIVMPRRG